MGETTKTTNVGTLLIHIRTHQEYFGKGIAQVFFSGIYSYPRDISTRLPDSFSANGTSPDTRDIGSPRVSMSTTHIFESGEADTLDSILQCGAVTT